MKTSIFCSTAPIGKGHGGGVVSYYERLALQDVTKLVRTIAPCTTPEVKDCKVIDLGGHYPNNPFMTDYLYSLSATHADIAFFNGAPFGSTVKAINPSKVIVDCPAHDLELSIEEHEKQLGKYPYEHMTDPFLWQLYTDFIRNADVVICPSKMSAEHVKKNPGTKAKVVVIPHGVDLPEQVIEIKDEFIVGYLGAIGPDKGLRYLLMAWAGLMYKDAELLLRTDPIPAEWASIFTKGQKLDRVERMDSLGDFYNEISVYVQPSVTEGFGIPVLEAMAHGRPVIVTEGAGVSELVQDGVEGFVVPIRNPAVIADKIDYLKQNRDKMVEMGQAARKKAEQYPWNKVVESLKGVI